VGWGGKEMNERARDNEGVSGRFPLKAAEKAKGVEKGKAKGCFATSHGLVI